MNIVIEKSELVGEVNVIASKSYAHRILICSAFCNSPTIIYNLPTSQDILATKNCLKELGCVFEEKNYCKVYPISQKVNNATLNVGESGSSLRFLLPIASAIGGEFTFVGTEKLMSRPSLPLLNCLKENGIDYQIGKDYIKINGSLTSCNFKIDASLSSQYLTGLMLALPLLKGGKIECNKLSSKGYVEITKQVMQYFGVNFADGVVHGNYLSPNEITVEGDWSNALFFAVGGLLNGNVKINGLNVNTKQGDKRAFEILKDFGADNLERLIFKRTRLNGVNYFADDIPDAIPCLSLVMATANGSSSANGVERLKIKESNRLQAITEILDKSKVKYEYNNDCLTVYNGTFKSGLYNGYNDHRIVMTLAIMGSMVGGVEITDAQAVNKSYPTFFEEFKRLGGKFWIK